MKKEKKRNSDTQGERESFKCTDWYRDKNINYKYRNWKDREKKFKREWEREREREREKEEGNRVKMVQRKSELCKKKRKKKY